MKEKLMRKRSTSAFALSAIAAAVASTFAVGNAVAQDAQQKSTQDAQQKSTMVAQADTTAATPTTPATAPLAANESTQPAEIIVTGSRIKQPALASVSPITTVTAEDIKYQGTTRVEDMLNSLPQVFADQGGAISNGATGTATVNLRGLGAERTLVLINGKRMLPGDPSGPSGNNAPDLNFIPAALIERVDVATGGASAVYGSDAVAGVVNFIMKRDFQGVSFSAQRSGYWHDNDDKAAQKLNEDAGFGAPNGTTFDGKGWDLSAVLGVNTDDGKGNVTAYTTYRQIDALAENRRDYSACAYGYNADNSYKCGGSGTSANGTFYNADFDQAYGYDQASGQLGDEYATLFNYGPYNYFQRNDERYTLGAFAHYEVNEHFEAYSDLMFMNDSTNAVIAPSGDFANFLYQAPCDGSNPLIPTAALNTLCSADFNPNTPGGTYILRRNVEGGGRDDDLTHSSYRILLGGRGTIVDDISYDVYGQFGRTTLNEVYRNDFSVNRLQNALNVVNVGTADDPVAACANGGSDGCVPWNIWAPGGVTQAALDYLQVPLLIQGHTEQRIASASISGSLGEYGIASPLATNGVGFAFGTEYRQEQSVYEPDVEFQTGDGAGQGAPTKGVAGGFHVKEIFGELKVPIVQDKPFAKDLGVELGYRYSDHSIVDTMHTYKLGANWSPSDDVALRGGYNRAVRAPNITELNQPTFVALDGATDPCAGDTPDSGCSNDPYFQAR